MFYFYKKYFVLFDHILSETLYFFVSVFCSQIFTLELNFQPAKLVLTYAISIDLFKHQSHNENHLETLSLMQSTFQASIYRIAESCLRLSDRKIASVFSEK